MLGLLSPLQFQFLLSIFAADAVGAFSIPFLLTVDRFLTKIRVLEHAGFSCAKGACSSTTKFLGPTSLYNMMHHSVASSASSFHRGHFPSKRRLFRTMRTLSKILITEAVPWIMDSRASLSLQRQAD